MKKIQILFLKTTFLKLLARKIISLYLKEISVNFFNYYKFSLVY